MPNRILKESIKRCEQIDQLSWFEEVVYYRLLVTADDYGCFDGRPVLLKNELFPTRDNVTKKAVEDAIAKLVNVGLLRFYNVSDKPYVCFPTWETHQTVRRPRHKYPVPTPDGQCPTSDGQVRTNDGQCPAESNPIRIQSESNPNPNKSTEPPSASMPPPVISFPLNDGELYPVLSADVEKWEQLYPAVDVRQELREMLGWLDAHPQKRKTKRGINGFITGWLGREQDRGGNKQRNAGSKPRPDTPEQRAKSAQALKADVNWVDAFLAENGGGG